MKNTRHKIIIVDDNITNLTMGSNILKTFYDIIPVPSPVKFFEILEKIRPDLILLDVEMPEMSGYEVIKKLKRDIRFMGIPVIFLTARKDETSELEGFELGAVDYISKPFSAPLLLKRIANQLLIVQQKKDLLASQAALSDYAENLERKVQEKTKEVVYLRNAVLTSIADLVEFRDELTGGHIYRTQLYLKTLTEELINERKYTDETCTLDLDVFLSSAPLHDVGKIAITDLILNKPDKLSSEEFAIMKTHVSVGVDAIETIMNHTEKNAFLRYALLIAGTHHEKWDGTGYPQGLKGEEIPLQGRIMAIVDVYDALTNNRYHRRMMAHKNALDMIKNLTGTHIDPNLAQIFLKHEKEFNKEGII